MVVRVDPGCTSAGTHQGRLLVRSNDPDENPYPNGVQVSITVPEVSDVVYDDIDVDTDSGNNDGVINPGEVVELDIVLRNLGNEAAVQVTAELSTESLYANILDATAFYSSVGRDGTPADGGDTVSFQILAETPGNTPIPFDLDMTSSTGDHWQDGFVVVAAPDTDPPLEPSLPEPADGAALQETSLRLRWSAVDPNGDDVSYDAYVYTEHPFQDLAAEAIGCRGVSEPYCDVDLEPDQRYYWYVIATDEHNATTSGKVWTFSTRAGEVETMYLPLIVNNY